MPHPLLRALLRAATAPDSSLCLGLGGYALTFVRWHVWPQVWRTLAPAGRLVRVLDGPAAEQGEPEETTEWLLHHMLANINGGGRMFLHLLGGRPLTCSFHRPPRRSGHNYQEEDPPPTPGWVFWTSDPRAWQQTRESRVYLAPPPGVAAGEVTSFALVGSRLFAVDRGGSEPRILEWRLGTGRPVTAPWPPDVEYDLAGASGELFGSSPDGRFLHLLASTESAARITVFDTEKRAPVYTWGGAPASCGAVTTDGHVLLCHGPPSNAPARIGVYSRHGELSRVWPLWSEQPDTPCTFDNLLFHAQAKRVHAALWYKNPLSGHSTHRLFVFE